MPSVNLIVALVFAALFGAGLVFLALYLVHSYVRKRCLELDHWFHLLTPKQLRSPCRHCEGTGRDVRDQSRSRSSQRKSRSRTRAGRERSQYGKGEKRMGQSMMGTDTEWNAIGPGEGQLRGGGQGGLQRPRHTLPAAATVQSPGVAEHYNPWQTSSPKQYVQPAMYPQKYPQISEQAYLDGPQMDSYAMPAPLPWQKSIPVPSSTISMPPYKKPVRGGHKERSEVRSRSKSRSTPNDSTRVRTTDYIHIVDEYPPIIKEAIRKAAPPPVSLSMLSSSDSSTSTEPVEEVPRVSIPRAVPRFAEPSPFTLSHYPQVPTRAWNMPMRDAQQWDHHGRPLEQPRYASPYARPGVWAPPHTELRKPPHDSLHTSPCQHMNESAAGRDLADHHRQ